MKQRRQAKETDNGIWLKKTDNNVRGKETDNVSKKMMDNVRINKTMMCG